MKPDRKDKKGGNVIFNTKGDEKFKNDVPGALLEHT